MIALDTSVLARYILRDTLSELAIAEQLLEEYQCSVSWSVLIELCWVLERSAGLPRQEVVDGLSAICGMASIAVPDQAKLAWALARYADGADFADMVHLASAVAGSSGFATFDRKLVRQSQPGAPLEVRTLGN